MAVEEIIEGDVARACKVSTLGDDGKPSWASFRLRKNEKHISFFLLEDDNNKSDIIKLINTIKEMGKHNYFPKKNEIIAILNIEKTKKRLAASRKERKLLLSFMPVGLPHCELHHNHADHNTIAELLVECIEKEHIAKDIEQCKTIKTSPLTTL